MKYFLGSFAINFGKPNSSDTYLNDYMIEKYNNHEDNNNDTFVTHAYLNNIIGCNQPDSFLNFVKKKFLKIREFFLNRRWARSVLRA